MSLVFETDFSDCVVEGNKIKRNGKVILTLNRSSNTIVEIVDCDCEGGKALHLKCSDGDAQPKLRIELNIPYKILKDYPHFKVETGIRFPSNWQIHGGVDDYGWAILNDPVIEWEATTQKSYYIGTLLQRYFETYLFSFYSRYCCPSETHWTEPPEKTDMFPMFKLGEFNKIEYTVERGNSLHPNGDVSFAVNDVSFLRGNVRTWGMKDRFTSSVCKLYGEDIPKERWVSHVRLYDMSSLVDPCLELVCDEGFHCEVLDGVPICVKDEEPPPEEDNRFLLLFLGVFLVGLLIFSRTGMSE